MSQSLTPRDLAERLAVANDEIRRLRERCRATEEALETQIAGRHALLADVAMARAKARDWRDARNIARCDFEDLRSAVAESSLPDCPDCRGMGEINEVVQYGIPSALDRYQPAEGMEAVPCDGCWATGKSFR